MKLNKELLKKIEPLPKLKWEDINGKIQDIKFEYQWGRDKIIQDLILEKIHHGIAKEKVLADILSNGLNKEEAEELIHCSLSVVFKNSKNLYDHEDSLENFVGETNSRLESLENKPTEYKYKPLSFRVNIELCPNWFNIIQKIAEKNNLTAVEYFRDFLNDSGFDQTHLKGRETNPKMLRAQDINNDNLLREWLNNSNFDLFANNFANGFLSKKFNFTYFSDTITGKKISFGNIGNEDYLPDPSKKLLSADRFRGRIISRGSRKDKEPLPLIDNVSTYPMDSKSLPYFKYLPLFNPVMISPNRMYFELPDELGAASVYWFGFNLDESLKKLEWKQDEYFPMFPVLNDMIEFYLSRFSYGGSFHSEENKNHEDFPIMIKNILKKNEIKYLKKTDSDKMGSSISDRNWHTFENKYCTTRINVEIFSPEITLHPIEYYKFDVNNGVHEIRENLKKLGYL